MKEAPLRIGEAERGPQFASWWEVFFEFKLKL